MGKTRGGPGFLELILQVFREKRVKRLLCGHRFEARLVAVTGQKTAATLACTNAYILLAGERELARQENLSGASTTKGSEISTVSSRVAHHMAINSIAPSCMFLLALVVVVPCV